MGKARSFSNEANEIVFQTESNNENFALGSQQNSYNLGSVHFSDQSGIGNFSQSGINTKYAQVKGSLFQGNIGHVQQTVELDVGTSTINLNNDSTGAALAVISQDRIVTLSAGFASDLTTITGAQRPGQVCKLYNIFSNTITIKNDAGATVNTIVTPGATDFILSGHGLVTLAFDVSLAQWRIENNLGGSGGDTTLPVVDTTSIVKGSVDATKLMRFEVDTLVPAATTVVLTVPAADTTLAGLSIAQTFTANNTFSGSETIITSTLFTVDSDLITIGDAPTDILNIIAHIGSSIIPTTTDTFDIGSASLQWNQIYIKTINAITETTIASPLLTITSALTTFGDAPTDILNLIAHIGSSIIPTVTDTFQIGSAALEWNQIFTKEISALTETTITSPLLTITSALTTFGDAPTDIFNFVGVIGSSLIPNLDVSFDLGSASKEWKSLFVATINAFTETTISSPILSIDSSIINLGDTSADNINFTAQIATQMIIEEITVPGTPPANTLTLYAKLDGGFSKLFYKQEDGTEVGPLGTGGGGGAQTPWLSDIDADVFSLIDLGLTVYATGLFGASTEPFSVYDGTNLRWHVPTAGGFVWTIGAFDGILGLGPSVVNVFKVLDMQNANKIINVNDPTADQDVVTKKYLEDNPTIPQGIQDVRIWDNDESSEFDQEVWLSNSKSGAISSSAPIAEDIAYYVPIFVGKDVTLRQIGVDVTVGVGTSIVTLAIYDSYPDQNYPRDRLDFDTSTNSLASGTGIRKITSFFEALTPGLYWLLFRTDTAFSIKHWSFADAESVGHSPENGDSGEMNGICGYTDELTDSTPDATADTDMDVIDQNNPFVVSVPTIYARFNS